MMPTAYDTWVLSRVMTSQTLNGELNQTPEAWRPLGECLAELPPDRRTDALGHELLTQSDRDAVIRAIADADPSGPPPAPEADGEPDDGWGPLRLPTLPPVERF